MSVRVTVELPSELADQVRNAAARAQRPFEEVLVDWIHRGAAEPSVDELTDGELLTLCDHEMANDVQDELADLLDRNREESLDVECRKRLNELMQIYRRGLVRKAQALREAVSRGLRPSLS